MGLGAHGGIPVRGLVRGPPQDARELIVLCAGLAKRFAATETRRKQKKTREKTYTRTRGHINNQVEQTYNHTKKAKANKAQTIKTYKQTNKQTEHKNKKTSDKHDKQQPPKTKQTTHDTQQERKNEQQQGKNEQPNRQTTNKHNTTRQNTRTDTRKPTPATAVKR